MMKTKHLVLLLVCMATIFTACMKNNNDYPGDQGNFDAAAQFTKDTVAIRAYVKAKNIPALKDEKTGLFYQIITPGTGSVNYSGSTSLTVNYTGSLLDGTVFDSSKGTAVTFKSLGSLIRGWQVGIPLIQPGGRIRLIMPSGLGYGNATGYPFPPNSNLDFTIDVLSAQ
ncbi:hypothetical protein TH53_09315 [Pedobacter lusitanus]|uniref:Peptidyl-prolyl cis-trans isomerase n=1 Tax=Pedobacter lusitanus TaxID=1503925 RepID=A0A0D0F768_9SPHI|nr:FKBP-type peptidyl-prolyl cis-trans isomerase [Pedobacter lusitanus]KIO77463.1 hypothetical protein TH53_09315 [Pedobacter lusitanus]